MTAAEATRNWRGITIAIEMGEGRPLYRPACFVFDIPGGFAWVEPAYFDAPVSAPAVHETQATVEDFLAVSVAFEGRPFSGEMKEYRPEDGAVMGEALDWWLGEYVPASGKTIAELRAWAAERLGLQA